MTEFGLDQVVREAEDALRRDDEKLHSVSLPSYVATNVHSTLLVLKAAPKIMDIIEDNSSGLTIERPTGLCADIISTLCEKFNTAVKESRENVSLQLNYAQLHTYARLLEQIGGSIAVEGGNLSQTRI